MLREWTRETREKREGLKVLRALFLSSQCSLILAKDNGWV